MGNEKSYVLSTHGFDIYLSPQNPFVPVTSRGQIRMEVEPGKLNDTLKDICSEGTELQVTVRRAGRAEDEDGSGYFKTNLNKAQCVVKHLKKSELGIPFEKEQCMFIKKGSNKNTGIMNEWIEEIKDCRGNVTGILFIEEETNPHLKAVWGEMWDEAGVYLLHSFVVWNYDYGHRVIVSVNAFGEERILLTDRMSDDEWTYRFWETDPAKRTMAPVIAAAIGNDHAERSIAWNTYLGGWRTNIKIRERVEAAVEKGRNFDIRDIFYAVI